VFLEITLVKNFSDFVYFKNFVLFLMKFLCQILPQFSSLTMSLPLTLSFSLLQSYRPVSLNVHTYWSPLLLIREVLSSNFGQKNVCRSVAFLCPSSYITSFDITYFQNLS